jgi:hypothetical protein
MNIYYKDLCRTSKTFKNHYLHHNKNFKVIPNRFYKFFMTSRKPLKRETAQPEQYAAKVLCVLQ